MIPQGNITCGKAQIKYKGEYNWNRLYKLIYSWLQKRHYEVDDKRYKDKMSATGKELKVDIIAERRETAYTKRFFNFKIRNWDMLEKPKEINGDTQLITGGRLYIKITGSVQFDWQGIFKGNKFMKWMGTFYDWIMKKEHELVYIDDQEYEVLRIEHEIKKHLNMETATMAFEHGN